MARKIPVTVITGFLGAGKTSLLRHLATHAGGRRLAFLINEFGDLGVDRELLLGCGLQGCGEGDVVELANGCICCAVAEDFLPAMTGLLRRDDPPEHILIETSGLALPKPLVGAFNWPEVKTRATVDGVIALVDVAAAAAMIGDGALPRPDARDAAHEDGQQEVFADQLFCADLVVLNKTDLITAPELAQLQEKITAVLRPGARLLTARRGEVPPTVALGLAAAAEENLTSRPSLHDGAPDDHDHDDFDSFVVAPGPVRDAEALQRRLREIAAAHRLFRIKGFLDRPGLPRREVIQGVGPRFERYFDRDWRTDENRESRLVIIGPHGMDRAAVAHAVRDAVATAA